MSDEFDGLLVHISGPLLQVARFQKFLQSFDGRLSLDAGEGADTGIDGYAVLRWAGRRARPPALSVRGPRSGRKRGR